MEDKIPLDTESESGEVNLKEKLVKTPIGTEIKAKKKHHKSENKTKDEENHE